MNCVYSTEVTVQLLGHCYGIATFIVQVDGSAVPLNFNCLHHTISSSYIGLNLGGQCATIRR